MTSEAISECLILKNFPGGACPQTPLVNMYALLVHHHNGCTNLKLYQIREFFWAHLCKGEKLTNYTPDNSSHCTVDSPSLLLVHNSHTHLCSECLVMKVHSVTHWYQSTVMLIITVGHYSPDPCSYIAKHLSFLVMCTFINLVFPLTLLNISFKRFPTLKILLWWFHHASSKILQVQKSVQAFKSPGVEKTEEFLVHLTGTTVPQNVTLLFVKVAFP